MTAVKTLSYGASGSLIGGKSLKLMKIERETPKSDEVLIEVLYCGVCHSDLHQVNNDWMNTIYPCVPGHEIIGRVKESGSAVNRFKIGDIVGVGCMIDSCDSCTCCTEGEEQYCEGPVSWTATYNGYIKPQNKDFNTFGGYSETIVVKEKFVLTIPANLEISSAAPILCAGVTTYSPLKNRKISAGDKVGIVGLGGLGHMAVMIANAMGAEVTVITTSEDKEKAALELGAHKVLFSEDDDIMKSNELTLDFILCTIPDMFDLNPYVSLLKKDGSLVTVGLLGPYKLPLNNMEVAFHRRSISGSLIGSLAETQEVLDFCAANNIKPQVQIIKIQEINEAFEKMKTEEVRFRYVIDMLSLQTEK